MLVLVACAVYVGACAVIGRIAIELAQRYRISYDD
jgi:hypothetical protein